MDPTRARRDGLSFLLVGAVFFLLFGIVLMNSGRVALFDFRTSYFSGVCLLQHCDPYSESEVAALYAQHSERWPVSAADRQVITCNQNLPPVFAWTVPLALLPFGVAQALWFVLIAGSFLLVALLMAWESLEEAPLLACSLVAFCLANSGSVLYFGNTAGFVVPFCVFAAWCFRHERFIFAGIAFLAVGLAFKPHDVGFVWLFFLLVRGRFRTYALGALALLAAFGVPALLWTFHLSPNWLQEIRHNMGVFSAPGAMNDPSGGHGTLVLTNLQTITSFFWPDPHTYNLASYLFCAPLFLYWGYVTLRARPTVSNFWIALASVAPLSMLPVYHRQYDAKLILLAVPACVLLWKRRGAVRWAAVVVTWTAFFLNGDLPWVVFLGFVNRLHPISQPYSRLLTAIWDFPVPLSLLGMGVFYLGVYANEGIVRTSTAGREAGEVPDRLSRIVQ